MNEMARTVRTSGLTSGLTGGATGDTHRDAGAGGVTSFEKFLRGRLIAQLGELRHGRVIIADACGVVELGVHVADEAGKVPRAPGPVPGEAGDISGAAGQSPREARQNPAVLSPLRQRPTSHSRHLTVRIDVRNPAFYRAVAANGSVGAGESYMEGHWRCDDLVALVRLLVRNRDLLDGMETGLARLGGWLMRAWHAAQRNTRTGSRRNIAAHYDLGNEFFSLFLSPDLMYSSAMWAGEGDTLAAASTRKLDRICAKLDLRPGQRVVEIGTGWGGFALHAARHYGCHVTTTTISREQHALATQRVAEAGLGDRVTLLLKDYRDLEGQYDRLVSIEMIEAIGAQYLDTYFEQLSRLLKPDGLTLVQAITIEDHRYEQALHAVDFIKRHVFPGSFIPSINAILAAKTHASDLALTHLEDFGLSYARTLRAWREAFLVHLPQVRQQGFDDRFSRMWEFYLAYCEGGFEERSIGVAHLLMAKPGYRPTAA